MSVYGHLIEPILNEDVMFKDIMSFINESTDSNVVLNEVTIKQVGTKIKSLIKILYNKILELIKKVKGLISSEKRKALEKRISSLQKDLSEADKKVSELKSELDSVRSNNEELSGEVKILAKYLNIKEKIASEPIIYFNLDKYLEKDAKSKISELVSLANDVTSQIRQSKKIDESLVNKLIDSNSEEYSICVIKTRMRGYVSYDRMRDKQQILEDIKTDIDKLLNKEAESKSLLQGGNLQSFLLNFNKKDDYSSMLEIFENLSDILKDANRLNWDLVFDKDEELKHLNNDVVRGESHYAYSYIKAFGYILSLIEMNKNIANLLTEYCKKREAYVDSVTKVLEITLSNL